MREARKTNVLSVRNLDGITRFDLEEGDAPDGKAFDSAGHETHDGDGKGHEAGETGHQFILDDARAIEAARLKIGENPSLDASFGLRESLRQS